MTNDEKIENVKKRKILKVFIIIFGLLTVFFAILSLVINFNVLACILTFLVEALLSRKFKSLDPKVGVTDSKNQE